MTVWPARWASRPGSISNRSRATSRSSILGLASANVTGSPARGAHQMQAQTPEVAGVAGAVAVAGPAGQVGPLGGGPGPAALDRGRVDQPRVVGPARGLDGQHPDQRLDQPRRRPAAACCSRPGPAGTGTSTECWWAWRSQRVSDVNPNNACITASVTSSASLSFGAIPTAGRHGASSGGPSTRHRRARTVQ